MAAARRRAGGVPGRVNPAGRCGGKALEDEDMMVAGRRVNANSFGSLARRLGGNMGGPKRGAKQGDFCEGHLGESVAVGSGGSTRFRSTTRFAA